MYMFSDGGSQSPGQSVSWIGMLNARRKAVGIKIVIGLFKDRTPKLMGLSGGLWRLNVKIEPRISLDLIDLSVALARVIVWNLVS